MNKNVITQDDLAGIWLDGVLMVTHARTHIASIKGIVGTMEKVVRTKRPLFLETSKWSPVRGIHITPLGDELISCMKLDLDEIERHYPKHRFHPLYTLFKRYCGRLYDPCWRSTPETLNQLREAVKRIRRLGRGAGVKRRLDNMRRTERSNAREAKSLLRAVRELQSKTLAVRVDFGYESIYSSTAGIRALAVSHEEAADHRAQLLAFFRSGPFKDVKVAYIWKMESALEKGLHFHMLFLFDGQKVRQDIKIGDMLGEHWTKVITQGKGAYFSCNKKKEAYVKCGIGMLNRGDDEMWDYLHDAVRYLTKRDLFFRLEAPPKAKTFGVGGPYKKK